MSIGCWLTDKVLVPGPTCILQAMVDAVLCLSFQIIYLRVFDTQWEVAHVLFQCLVHQLQTIHQKFQMVGGRDVKPLIGTSGGVGDEVRKGFVEGFDREIDTLMENKE